MTSVELSIGPNNLPGYNSTTVVLFAKCVVILSTMRVKVSDTENKYNFRLGTQTGNPNGPTCSGPSITVLLQE